MAAEIVRVNLALESARIYGLPAPVDNEEPARKQDLAAALDLALLPPLP